MAKIKLLPREVYSKIAAGEVIDGPYSVVRELIDNSVDAEAGQIKVYTKNGGKELIVVQDDGTGMSWEDAELALKRHATSKISEAQDLEHIRTMGFRGEALSSISSVSDFELITKDRESDSGVKLNCEYGRFIKIEPVPFSAGTKISVRNLFENLPARKRFMKSNRSENSRVKDVVIKKALCFNGIAFRYESEDSLVITLPKGQSKIERIKNLFGEEIEKHLIKLEYREDRLSIGGFITDRNYTLSNRNGQYLFINKRPIYNRTIQYIINEAAKRFITQGRYIYAFIYIDISPELVDVNVHPAKLEVKIKIEKDLSSALYRLIQNAYQSRVFYSKKQLISDNTETVKLDNFLKKESENKNNRFDLFKKSLSEDKKEGLFLVRDQNKPIHEPNEAEKSEVYMFSELKTSGLVAEELRSAGINIDSLKYAGSIFNEFLIFDESESLLLVDQHAAHERILYEIFTRKYDKLNPSKNLLVPINLTPPPGMYDDILDHRDDFLAAGIEIEPFGDDSINIVSIPALLPEDKEFRIVLEFFNEYFERRSIPEEGSLKERFLKYAACKSAIKEGDRINGEEASYLLKELLKCNIPYMCPHGRPTLLRIKRDYIERIFKRR